MHEHSFIPSDKYKDYEICTGCGSYHSTALAPLDEVYVDNPYWGENSGRSTWEQQQSNISCIDECGISKIDRVLQFVPKRGRLALEIAASPGVMINRLLDRNFDVYAIEPKPEYCTLLAQQSPEAKIICGYFPEVSAPSQPHLFDCIVAMDIMEHTPSYDDFFNEVHRLLIDGGTAIVMSPIILDGDGFLRARDMQHPNEHAWILTQKFLEPYLKEKFSSVEFKSWIVGHEIVILKK